MGAYGFEDDADCVGGIGRAPGWGGGGRDESAVVVAGTEAGRVRVGVGVVSSVGLFEAVLGVMPSGFMGAFLWIGMGGILGVVGLEKVVRNRFQRVRCVRRFVSANNVLGGCER